ncbi:transposase [Bacillus albus]|uniref:tyrosine-type recombinase/integrase n=1 Tax=Bacillus albus TaxID=2026189 RepID=UPI001009AB3F|nr:tyrosine-type recombinase/integrase [Bacillus albus]RXJ11120.1 transposase [Bacillus albus]RXJ23356.1 transposase [Bacillus albus]RXJ23490.1 transposase [Bacillus albus]RXJ35234.1 transposase [Bacillus albus]RXJ50933.1 transposase [Bacillus albus]
MKISNKGKVIKDKWHEVISIREAQTDNGTMYYLMDENLDFIPLVKGYLDMIQARAEREVSPNTIRTYCYNLWYFIVYLKIKGLNILDLDGRPDILTNFKLWIKNPYRFYESVEMLDYEYAGDALKVTTVNAILDRVSSLFLWLKTSGRIKDNPVVYRNVMLTNTMRDKDMLSHTRRNRTVQMNTLKSKVPHVIPKIIEQKAFNKYLEAVNLLRDKIILLVLKEGGLRSGELLGIKLEDIDYGEQGIHVRFRPDNANGSRAKAGYGRDRFVHLPSDLIVLIDTYISSDWVNSDPNTDFLFVVVNSNNPIENGKPMKKSTLTSILNYYNKKTEIKLNTHKLRHTHVTELAREYISKGESINWKYIQERIGHKNVTTTMGTYAHLNVEDYKKEYRRMSDYREEKRKERENDNRKSSGYSVKNK